LELQHTPLKGCFILKPDIFKDNRGFFYETYNKTTFKKITGLSIDFVQDILPMALFGAYIIRKEKWHRQNW